MTAVYSVKSGEGENLHGKWSEPFPTRLFTLGFPIVCLVLVCISARDGILNLYDRWIYEEEYGYGIIVAALTPFLLWRRWHLLTSTPASSRWPGLAIIVVAQLAAVLASLGESFFIEQLALVFSLAGVALVVFGWRATRVLLPLVILLLLTIPLPYTLQAMLTIKLQLVSTNLGVAIIQLLQIPVYVEGNIIDLGSYKLQVAEACSGLRYLLPLTCISFLIAYLYKASFWKKAALVVSAAPITIAINSFRIAMTAVLVNAFGIQMAEGFFHQFEGWIVFLMGVCLLAFEILALEGFRWSKVEIEPLMERSSAGPSSRMMNRAKVALPLSLAILVCAGTLGLTASLAAKLGATPALVRDNFSGFPRQLGGWSGQATVLDAETLDALKATDTLNADFVQSAHAQAAPVNLFVAYYDSLSKGAAIHSPRVCLPGSGWEFASFEEKNFSDLDPGMSGSYNDVVIQKGEQKMLMYYWYQQPGHRTADEFTMKYHLLVDSLFKARKDGALVRLFTPIDAAAGDKALADARARLQAFAQAALPKLSGYLPN